MGFGFRGAALLGVVAALVAPACGGQSLSRDDDDESGDAPRPPDDDDIVVGDDGSWGGGGTGSNQGGASSGGLSEAGMGAVGNMGGVSAVGGAVSSGGTIPMGGVEMTGGGPPTGGVAGIPATGGTMPIAGSGGTGGVNTDPYCKGIRTNSPCMPERKLCEGLLCGLADSGRRTCSCSTNWSCTACDYSNSPFRDPPVMIPACPREAADEVACTQQNAVCGPVGTEYCACYLNPLDGLIWDCDDPPSTWPQL